ncbi:MAG: PorT family protein, partial [Bacteroidia bacterium]|nr:PorT family protein [Bacteroidia bacterium]
STVGYSQLGFKTGFGVSDIAFKKYGQTLYIGYENNGLIHEKPLVSYEFGIFMNHRLSGKWDVQTEFLYAARGINYNKQYLYDEITYQINIGYLQLPVLLGFKLSSQTKGGISFYLGPYGSLLLFAHLNKEIEGVKAHKEMNGVRVFDFGSIVGFKVERKLESGSLLFDFRIGYSLVNMMDPIDGYFLEYNNTPDEYARNIGIIFSIGYRFNDLFKKGNEK